MPGASPLNRSAIFSRTRFTGRKKARQHYFDAESEASSHYRSGVAESVASDELAAMSRCTSAGDESMARRWRKMRAAMAKHEGSGA